MPERPTGYIVTLHHANEEPTVVGMVLDINEMHGDVSDIYYASNPGVHKLLRSAFLRMPDYVKEPAPLKFQISNLNKKKLIPEITDVTVEYDPHTHVWKTQDRNMDYFDKIVAHPLKREACVKLFQQLAIVPDKEYTIRDQRKILGMQLPAGTPLNLVNAMIALNDNLLINGDVSLMDNVPEKWELPWTLEEIEQHTHKLEPTEFWMVQRLSHLSKRHKFKAVALTEYIIGELGESEVERIFYD